jgi:hypothetical protein
LKLYLLGLITVGLEGLSSLYFIGMSIEVALNRVSTSF